MSLRNPALLYGLALVVLPILLHLLMRAKPKKLIFPALRLIQQRKKSNTRRMRIRHWWLLLLRMLVIGLIVLALTRPVLPAANYGLSTTELLTLIALIGGAATAYFLTVGRWKRAGIPGHTLRNRQTSLRLWTGIALTGLIAVLVGWPYANRIQKEIKAPIATDLPVAAIFLFDTSPSMEYLAENQDRLSLAKGFVQEQLTRLPRGSQIAIGDATRPDEMQFSTDQLVTASRLDDVETGAAALPLEQAIQAALRLHREDRAVIERAQSGVEDGAKTDRFLREIYLVTDLSSSAWRSNVSQALQDTLAEQESVHLYLIDVGDETPTNTSLSDLKLSTVAPLEGDELVIEAEVVTQGEGVTDRTAELSLRTDRGELTSKGRKSLRLSADGPTPISFTLPKVTGPIVQGELRLSGRDPLAVDDVRYFTLEVRTPPRVLIVSPTNREALNLSEALAPAPLREIDAAPFRVDVVRPSKFTDADLDDYSVVCLVNVRSPGDAFWERCFEYVSRGGGMAVFLGSRDIDNETYNTDAARAVLPTRAVVTPLKFTPPETFDVLRPEHPLFGDFEIGAGLGAITGIDIFQAWSVRASDAASTLSEFTGLPRPALLERSVGGGRVMLMTTGVDLVNDFNDLPRGQWAFIALTHRMMDHLSQASRSATNFTAGEEVRLKNDRRFPLVLFTLRNPEQEQRPIEVEKGAEFLPLSGTDLPGNYRIVDRTNDPPRPRGFSINVPASESDLTRLTLDDLTRRLGEDRFRIARDPEDLDRIVTTDRIGTEVFPLLVLLMIIVFCGEHFVANHFYRSDGEPMTERKGEPEPDSEQAA